jgi:hypothetical protein
MEQVAFGKGVSRLTTGPSRTGGVSVKGVASLQPLGPDQIVRSFVLRPPLRVYLTIIFSGLH